MEILQVNNVTQRFGQLAAVKDLSFEVEKGEIFGIAGPNGAGKSTLFNVITGFYHGSGDIIFDGTNISGLRPHQICHKGIARTFQIPQLFLTLPMVENVRVGAHFGVRGAHDERERINEAISLVGLQGKEKVIAANLNLFDKKLTLIAAALATKPKLLLLDEPIGGLSPTEVRESVALIQKINKELGLTIIVIEHLMKVLTKIAQRLMILHNGEKICLGSPEEVAKDKRVIEVYLGVEYA
jgi:branched-chain amino acid transport system ATP-binding protein